MKVLIIALDALEYDLVKKFDFKNLKQIEYGKIKLPIKKGEEPYTPDIWSSFITGKFPSEHKAIRIKYSPLINLGKKIVKSLKLDKRINVQIRELSRKKLGIKLKTASIKGKVNTIFDNKKSIVVSLPAYNEEIINIDVAEDIVHSLGEKATISKTDVEKKMRKGKGGYEDKKKILFKNLKKKNWEIFMAHFFLPDILQHIYFTNPIKIRKLYFELDTLVKEVKKRIGKDILLLVISDHGQKEGIHTPYGFYSLNKKLNLKKPKMIEFRKILEKQLNKN